MRFRRHKSVSPKLTTIVKATEGEMHSSFIRISEDIRNDLPSAGIAKVSANDRTIYVQVRGLENRYRTVQLSEWYRRLLNISNNPEYEIAFSVEPTNFGGKIQSFSFLPDPLQRMSSGFGLTGMSLTFVGLGIGMEQLPWTEWIKSPLPAFYIFGWLDIAVFVTMWVIAIWFLKHGMIALIRPEPID